MLRWLFLSSISISSLQSSEVGPVFLTSSSGRNVPLETESDLL